MQFNGANLAQSKLAQQIAGLRESVLARRGGSRPAVARAGAAVRRSLEQTAPMSPAGPPV
ncbi:MAG: hypothetical protein R3F11_29880 [Verrucomicrobiales bacterium]